MPIFTPPTHEEPIRSDVRPLNYFRYTWAASIVRVSGTLKSVRSPSEDLLTGLENGKDYFLGGYEYLITDEVADELTAAGFSDGLRPTGYGVGLYGYDYFGE